VTTKKKHKRDDIEVESAATVVVAAERAERGGRGSGIQIGEAKFHVEPRAKHRADRDTGAGRADGADRVGRVD
jgi:hypothetical protein